MLLLNVQIIKLLIIVKSTKFSIYGSLFQNNSWSVRYIIHQLFERFEMDDFFMYAYILS